MVGVNWILTIVDCWIGFRFLEIEDFNFTNEDTDNELNELAIESILGSLQKSEGWKTNHEGMTIDWWINLFWLWLLIIWNLLIKKRMSSWWRFRKNGHRLWFLGWFLNVDGSYWVSKYYDWFEWFMFGWNRFVSISLYRLENQSRG